MRWILGILMLAITGQAPAGTVIRGKAPAYVGEQVTLYTYADYLSYELKEITTTTVDEDSTFLLYFNHDKTFEAVLETGNAFSVLYVEPESTYDVYIDIPEKDQAVRFKRNGVDLYFDTLPPNDINYQTIEFDYRVDTFIVGTFELMANPNKAWKTKIDSFKMQLVESFDTIKSHFFLDYVTYSIAQIEQVGHIREDVATAKKIVYNDYLRNRPVLYHNPKYMELFNQFYENYLLLATSKFEIKLYNRILETDYSGLMAALGEDAFLQDKRIRELVFLKNVPDLFQSGKYPQYNLLELLDSVEQHSEFEKHREIAANVHKRLTHLKPGFKAPDFKIESTDGKVKSLENYRGKYVYLTFFAAWNTQAISELKILPELQERYGDDFVYVTISADDTKAELDQFLKKHPEMYWDFLYAGKYHDILEQYEVTALPAYFLIDPDGNIMQAPAYSPNPNGSYISIDHTFFQIQKKMKKQRDSNRGNQHRN